MSIVNEAVTTEEEPSANLEKSGLSIERGALVRRQKGKLIATHALADINSVNLQTRVDRVAVAISLVSLSVAIAAKLLIQTSGTSWVVFTVFCVVSLFAALGSTGRRLKVETAHGEVEYLLADPDDHCQGFAVALRAEVQRVRGGG